MEMSECLASPEYRTDCEHSLLTRSLRLIIETSVAYD